MVKIRPVIVLAVGDRSRSQLATVVPLSTSVPDPIHDHHCLLDSKLLPKTALFFQKQSWIKGDMVYTVGFERLSPILLGRQHGKRVYCKDRLSRETMRKVYSCVLHGLNLGDLAQHLPSNE